MGRITHGGTTRAGQAVTASLTGADFPECTAAMKAPGSPAAPCRRAKRVCLSQTRVGYFFLVCRQAGSKLGFNPQLYQDDFCPPPPSHPSSHPQPPPPQPPPTLSSGETLKGQPRDIISPMCPTSPPGSLTGRTCLNHHPRGGALAPTSPHWLLSTWRSSGSIVTSK